MAFFGITAFGPQNNFKTALVNAIGLTMFTDEEYKVAFTKIDKDKSGFITVDEVSVPPHNTIAARSFEGNVWIRATRR